MSRVDEAQYHSGSSSSYNNENDYYYHPVHKTLTSASNLANLLPTSTVLAFNALIPPFSNNGSCQPSNTFLTCLVVLVCAIFCFLSSFTDSFMTSDGKLYHGIATFNGLYIFNYNNNNNNNTNNGSDEDDEEETTVGGFDLCKFRIRVIDFIHAFLSLFVFLAFAISDSNVQNCLIPKEGANESTLIMNLPLATGVLSSFLFTIFPTTRRGIACGRSVPSQELEVLSSVRERSLFVHRASVTVTVTVTVKNFFVLPSVPDISVRSVFIR
ncbi:hypothetical protein HN51_054887 [Arachis hypogaea]